MVSLCPRCIKVDVENYAKRQEAGNAAAKMLYVAGISAENLCFMALLVKFKSKLSAYVYHVYWLQKLIFLEVDSEGNVIV